MTFYRKQNYTTNMSFIEYAGNYFKVPGFGEKPFVADDVRKTMIDISSSWTEVSNFKKS